MNGGSSAASSAKLSLVLTAAGLIGAYLLIGGPPLVGAEDANIGFRYARNLAEGHGLVFNPGGETVEGFTSLLWAFIMGGVYLVVGAERLEIVLLIISSVLTAVALACVLWILKDRARGFGQWVGTAWLASLAGYFLWSGLTLMDVALWSALLTVFVLVIYLRLHHGVSAHWHLPAIVVALSLTRPDTLLVAPAIVCVALAVYGLRPETRRIAIEVGATMLVATAALIGFRIAYFGYPLPNTYYTKVPPDLAYRLADGFRYVGAYVLEHPLAWPVLAAAVVCFAGAASATIRRPRSTASDHPLAATDLNAAGLFGGVVAVGFLSAIVVGGDHFQGHRFLQAYLPFLAVPLAVSIEELRARWVGKVVLRRGLLTISAAFALVLPVVEWRTVRDHAAGRELFVMAIQGRIMGEVLGEAFSPGSAPELGVWMAGGIGYTYPGPVKDVLGLNWVAMGHSPGDRKGVRDHAAFNLDVFWSEPPDIMLPDPEALIMSFGCTRVVLGGVLRGLLQTERFQNTYEPVRVRSDVFEPLILYARSDWLDSGAPPSVDRLGWAYCGER